MDTLTFVLVALATYRLTRLVTADKISQPLREVAVARSDFLGYLTSCDWCLSIWVAPIPVAVNVIWPTNRVILAGTIALACSAVAGLLSLAESRLDSSL
jgi:hypothetical protein